MPHCAARISSREKACTWQSELTQEKGETYFCGHNGHVRETMFLIMALRGMEEKSHSLILNGAKQNYWQINHEFNQVSFKTTNYRFKMLPMHVNCRTTVIQWCHIRYCTVQTTSTFLPLARARLRPRISCSLLKFWTKAKVSCMKCWVWTYRTEDIVSLTQTSYSRIVSGSGVPYLQPKRDWFYVVIMKHTSVFLCWIVASVITDHTSCHLFNYSKHFRKHLKIKAYMLCVLCSIFLCNVYIMLQK